MVNGKYYIVEKYNGEQITVSVDISGDEIVGKSAYVGTIDDVMPRYISDVSEYDILRSSFDCLRIHEKFIDENNEKVYELPQRREIDVCTFYLNNMVELRVYINYLKKHVSFYSQHSGLRESYSFEDSFDSIMREIEFRKNEILSESNNMFGKLKLISIKKSQMEEYPDLFPNANKSLGFLHMLRDAIMSNENMNEKNENISGGNQYSKKK